MIEAAVNKLMHEPTVHLRKMASENPEELEQATSVLKEVFGLSDDGPESGALDSEQVEDADGEPSLSSNKENLA